MRVLHSERRPDARTNPYLSQLFQATSDEGVEAVGWSFRTALLHRYDILHVHWPEFLVAKQTWSKRLLARMLFVAVIARLRLTSTPVVRTVHNAQPHEDIGDLDRHLLSFLDALVVAEIHMTETSRSDRRVPTVLIRHGDYRDWYRRYPADVAVRGRFGCVGSMRPYKGLERILEVFPQVQAPEVSLLIRGHSSSRDYVEGLARAAAADSRITFEAGFLDDAELVRSVTSCEIIVLPYRRVLNSGVALLALSLDRPVLAPSAPSVLELQRELGEDWILLFEGDLEASHLEGALQRSRRRDPKSMVDLSARTWKSIGQQHAAVYRDTIQGRRVRGSTAQGLAR